MKKLKWNCVSRYETHHEMLHLRETMNSQQTREMWVRNLIAWFLLKFWHSAIMLKNHFADMHRHTFAWCDSCSLTTWGWMDLLQKALESMLFYNAQIQLQWAVRKMQTSVETLTACTQTQRILRKLVRVQIRVTGPPHCSTWWVEHHTAGATTMSTSAYSMGWSWPAPALTKLVESMQKLQSSMKACSQLTFHAWKGFSELEAKADFCSTDENADHHEWFQWIKHFVWAEWTSTGWFLQVDNMS